MIGELLGIGNTASVYEWGKTEVIKIFHNQSHSMHEAKKEAKNAEIINNLNLRAPNYSGLLEYKARRVLFMRKLMGQQC